MTGRDGGGAISSRAKNKRTRGSPARPRGLALRVRRIALVGLLAAAAGGAGLIAAIYATLRIPEPAEIIATQSAVVLDRNGETLGRLAAGADRVEVAFEAIPQHLKDAVLAAEDPAFWDHPGISFPGIVRAAVVNLATRRIEQGGSTITQQYVKNAFAGTERTFPRKFREALLSLKLEREWPKEEILRRYLNAIYLGRGAYGVEAAARTYFGGGTDELTLAQSATLASLIRSPENLDPAVLAAGGIEPDRERNQVLERMAALGMVGREDAEAAAASPLVVRPRRVGGFAPHFLEDVRREVEARIGPALYSGDVVVRTTLDLELQRAAEDAIRATFDDDEDPEAALVAIDPATGDVRALVGARDFTRRQFNLATQGRRQPGSVFKPFVLAAALENGIGLGSVWPAPAEARLRAGGSEWRVRNYDRRDHGRPDLVRATALSINTAYAHLMLEVGPEATAEAARRAGVRRSALEPVASLALGTSPVHPIEIASAYATFAARGTFRVPRFVTDVRARGRTVESWPVREEQALERDVADRVTASLRAVIDAGTGRSAAFGRPAAGKTGTTEDHRDAWFVGYTPDLVTAVWVGYAEGGRTMEAVRGRAVTGGSFPATIWRAFMAEAHRGLPVRDLPAPPQDRSPSPTPTPSPSPDGGSDPSPAGTAPPAEESPPPGPAPSPDPESTEGSDPQPTEESEPPPADGDAPPAAPADARGDGG